VGQSVVLPQKHMNRREPPKNQVNQEREKEKGWSIQVSMIAMRALIEQEMRKRETKNDLTLLVLEELQTDTKKRNAFGIFLANALHQ